MKNVIRPALYARVSSQRQAEEKTIASQCEEIKKRIVRDGFHLLPQLEFCEDGHTGSELIRPVLEQLRDKVAAGVVNRIYVHSPDRLARKMAHQVLLLEEFRKYHCDVVFINQEGLPDGPEATLLVQMQGMIAEYEREKILERTRRGRRYSAAAGNISVLAGAPYGYRYISKSAGGGTARWEIDPIESDLVHWMFTKVAQDGYSLAKIGRELATRGVRTRKGRPTWDSATIRGILRNTAYYGEAKFFQSRLVARKSEKRPKRGDPSIPRQSRVAVATDPSEHVSIAVPPIIDESLFRRVGIRLDENLKRQREHKSGAKYLLSGLVLCGNCGSAFCGRTNGDKYFYYRCINGDNYRRAGRELCRNPSVNGTEFERVVWADLCTFLTERDRLRDELNRRRAEQQTPSQEMLRCEREVKQIRIQLDRLIDAYTLGLVDRDEFESRMAPLRARYAREESALLSLRGETGQAIDVDSIEQSLTQLALDVQSQLSSADFNLKRRLLQLLVHRIEIHSDEIRIVYKVPYPPFANDAASGDILQHWLSRSNKA